MVNFMLRIFKASVFLIAFVPFVFTWPYSPAASWASETLAFFLAAIVVLSGFVLCKKDELKIPVVGVLLLGLLVITLLSIVANRPVYIGSPFFQFSIIFLSTLLVIVVFNLRGDIDILSLLAFGFCIGSIAQLPVSLLQVFGGIEIYNQWASTMSALVPRFSGTREASGFLLQRNNLADYLFLGGLSFALLAANGKISNKIFGFGVFVLTANLALVPSRAIVLYLVFLVGLLLYLKFRKFEGSRSFQKYMLFVVLAFSIAQVMAPFLPIGSASMIDRVASEATFGVRWIEWQKAIAAFLENPLLGLGVGGYAHWSFEQSSLHPFVFSGDNPPLFTHSHNVILQLLAELGVFAGLLGFMIIFNIGKSFVLDSKKNASVAVFASLGIILLHSMVEFPLWYFYFFLVFVTFCGLQDQKSMKLVLSHSTLQVFFALIPIIFAIVSIFSLKIYSDLVSAAWPTKSEAETEGKLLDAVKLRTNLIAAEKADHILLWRLDYSDRALPFKLHLSESMMQYRPYQFVVFRRAVYLSYAGRQDDGVKLLRKALTISPGSRGLFLVNLAPFQEDKRLRPLIDILIESEGDEQ